jgi:hypothetical protein
LTVFQNTAGADAYITFHISNDYAGYFGLGGAENDLVWGGWSVGNARHRIFHSGNFTDNSANWNTAYGWGNHSGLYLGLNSKAADSELIDGIDSSRIVYGDGANGRSVSKTDGNANVSDSSNASGFYFGVNVTGMPTSDWWNWLTVRGNSWSGSDGYQFQLAGSFWSDDYRIRRMTSGANQAWVSIIHSGNIGSQSVNFATSSGNSATTDQINFTSLSINDSPVATEEFVASQGYITGSYLPLSGGTVTGTVTANRFSGRNTLVLNNYTTVNPASNVFLYSQPNDRDAWIFLDSADTGSNWGIYHRQIDSAVGDIPANSLGFVGGGASALQAYISLANGDAYFRGNLVIGGTFTEQSSIRYKKDVVGIESTSDRVELLKPVRYKKIENEVEEIGLIAEDVAELFPEVVKYDNEGRPDGINYSRLSVILLKAVQELTERVNKLENK